MTLFELQSCHALIEHFRHSESCADNMMEKDCEEALSWLEREIKLKTINPQTGELKKEYQNEDNKRGS